MQLYYHPVSTTSRPILLFAEDNGIKLDYVLVDLFTGAHLKDDYLAVNPCAQVPVLKDGDFVLTESSAVLKYLADLVGSSAYPTDLKQRARVNERMDWLNTGLYRDLGYGLIYPQCLPNYKWEDEGVQKATLQRAKEKAKRWLTILDTCYIGPRNDYVCGNTLTIADYLGMGMLTLGEVIHLNYSAYPNVTRWLNKMKSRPNYAKTHEGFYTYFVGPYKDAKFEGL